jgi:MFS transporter, MHS family, proline/betaine transporter
LTGLASTGIAVAYNTSVPIFGGFAPFIAAWLVATTGRHWRQATI